MMFKKQATLVLLPDEQSWKERQLLPDERSWKERQRLDFRKRDRRGYKRPDAGRKRDRRGYKRPDVGKRPKTHSGATGSSRYRKSGGNKQSTGRATHNQRMKREGAFIVKEEQEEEPAIRAAPCLSIMCGASPIVKQEQFTSKETEEEKEDEEKQRKCNSVFGCGKCFCDQCYPPGDALGRRR